MFEKKPIEELVMLCRKPLVPQGKNDKSGEFAVRKTYIIEIYSDGEISWDIREIDGYLMIYKQEDDELEMIYDQHGGISEAPRYHLVDCCRLLNALRKHMILDALADV